MELFQQCWGWGRIGRETVTLTPTRLSSPLPIQGLHMGKTSAFIWTDSKVYTWNHSFLEEPQVIENLDPPVFLASFGESLIVSDGSSELEVVQSGASLRFPAKVAMIECGSEHALALDQNGKVYAWGDGKRGKLGIGDSSSKVTTPRFIHLFEGVTVTQIACGYSHSLVLDNTGRVYAWGSGADGRLGTGDNQDCKEPRVINSIVTKFIKKISCGYLHSVVLSSTGEMLSFGFNGYGQLGLGHETSCRQPSLCYNLSCVKLIDVECGAFHTVVIGEDLSIYAMGQGSKGQLGNGNIINSSAPVLVPYKLSSVSPLKLICGPQSTILLCEGLEELNRLRSISVTESSELYELFSESSEYNFRPSNLPAKDEAEAAIQKKMIAKQARMYLERIREKEKQAKKKRDMQLLKEQKIREYMHIWETEVLPHWDKKRSSKDVVKLIEKGIPPKHRGEVWFRLAGNPLCITQEYFDLNLAKAKRLRESLANGEDEAIGKETSLKLIQQDIERTFNQLGYFKNGSPLQQQLKDLLEVFIIARPDIGYIQGMSYIGGTLALSLDIYRSFVLFSCVVTSPLLFPFYHVDFEGISSRFQLFRLLFKQNLPELCDHFEMEDVQPQMFLYEWFATMFSRNLGQDVVARIWDLYFYHGPVILFKTGLALLKLLNYLLMAEKLTGIMKTLQTLGEIIKDGDVLVEQIQTIKVPAWVHDELANFGQDIL